VTYKYKRETALSPMAMQISIRHFWYITGICFKHTQHYHCKI